MDPQLFRTKSIDQLISDADRPEKRLKKSLGWLSLTALGIGAIIGSGIFILTGTAAAGESVEFPSILKAPLLEVLMHGRHALGVSGRPGAGPAIAVSFFIVAIVCGLAGLCYAELASMIPIAGSAYTYTYATMGELVAWIIGWDLILEYAVSNMAVAVGFSAYINSLLDSFGLRIPDSLSTPAYSPETGWALHFNIMGFVIVMILTVLLVVGIRESAGANNLMVGIKLLAIVVFCIAAQQVHSPVELEAIRAERISGGADRRRDRVLHIYRVRLRIDSGRRVQGSASAIFRSGSWYRFSSALFFTSPWRWC